ncbi:MAG: hypothetical protein IKC95_03010 [Oscillospiraceae bacterium]|nr:hypothetical protein [Oscillospiraceae bacterium]
MAGIQNFRSALSGFNREDVVHYIEYLNQQHNSQLEQLNTQLQNAQDALARANAVPKADEELLARLEAAERRCADLEAQLSQSDTAPTDNELEAYRRAERAERMARERASQIYARANAVLAEATLKVESVSQGMNNMAEQISQQLDTSRQELQDAVTAMYAIRPEEE